MFIIFSLFISVDFLLRLLLVQLWRQGNSTKSQVAMEYASVAICGQNIVFQTKSKFF